MNAEWLDALAGAYGLAGEVAEVEPIDRRHGVKLYAFSVGSRRYVAKPGHDGLSRSGTHFRGGCSSTFIDRAFRFPPSWRPYTALGFGSLTAEVSS